MSSQTLVFDQDIVLTVNIHDLSLRKLARGRRPSLWMDKPLIRQALARRECDMLIFLIRRDVSSSSTCTRD